MQKRSLQIRQAGRKIAFVPTMGFLHEGHLSLVRIGRELSDDLVVSIFVNPTQFSPAEDFDAYPRDTERDLALCRKARVDAVFLPQQAQLYPQGYETYVQLERLPGHLCGLSRPLFFRGVATIVTKLFNIIRPHWAVFGEKDYQQLQVIRRMVQDLNMDVTVTAGPTVREPDGLAMSSRNSYLTPSQREAACSLFQALQAAKTSVAAGRRDAQSIRQAAAAGISAHPETEIDYIAICDPTTLEEVAKIEGRVLMALAVKVGTTRLIDNMLLVPGASADP